MKKECEIIRDLFPSYVENLVSESTSKFIEKHIASCSECREIFDDIKKDKIIEVEEDINEKEVEIKGIRKYRRRNIIIKIVILLLVISIVVLACFFSKYIHNVNILVKAHNKIQELESSQNIKITMEKHETIYNTQENVVYTTEYFYKDGKYKKTMYTNKEQYPTQTIYGQVDSKEHILINDGKQVVEKISREPVGKREIFQLINIGQNGGLFSDFGLKICYDISTENYNGKECYVIKNDMESSYSKIWIDKESMIKVKELNKIYGVLEYEVNYEIELNTVSDKDVAQNNITE